MERIFWKIHGLEDRDTECPFKVAREIIERHYTEVEIHDAWWYKGVFHKLKVDFSYKERKDDGKTRTEEL